MTLAVQSGRVLYSGNGALTSFAIPFDYSSNNNNVSVILKETSVTPFTETAQVYGTHYTISGGNVVFITAPSSTQKVLILRDVDLSQLKDFLNNAAFLPSDVEDGLDKIVMQIQQLSERLDRALKFYSSSVSSEIEVEDPVASQILVWDATASKLTSSTLANLASGGAVFVVGETPSGALSGTAYTIANAPNAGTFKLFINGERSLDFTLVGTALTTGYAPGLGGSLICDYDH